MNKNIFRRKSFRLFFMQAFLFLGAIQFIGAQETVKGNVKDEQGIPLPGANIIVTGTPVGAQADFDGNFEILVVESAKSFTISYLGYKNQIIEYTGQSVLNVVLKEDRSELDEVVVVGYGTQRAKDVTGAITKVKTKDIEKTLNATVEQALGGRISGVNTISSDGSLGAGIRVRVRGGTSIGATNEPLYVIDGLPIEADYSLNDYTGAIDGTSASPLANIDPGNIESIEVLKDASAAAIYGARGANGVILITTKQGKSGKTKMTFNTSVSLSTVPKSRFLDMMNTSDYGQYLINQKLYGNGVINDVTFSGELNGVEYTDFSADELQVLYNNDVATNWQDEFYRMGIITNHSFNATGGSENGNLFSVGGSFLNNEGTIANSYFKRYNFNFNNQYKLSKKLKLKTVLNPSYSVKKGPTSGGSFSSRNMGSIVKMLSRQPNRQVGQLIEDPLEDVGVWLDPITEAQRTKGLTTTFGLTGNALLTYEILKGFTFSTRLAGNYTNGLIKNFYSKEFGRGYQQGGIGTRYHYTNFNFNNQNLFNYRTTFGSKNNHRINALLGYTSTTITNQSERLETSAFEIETNGYDELQQGTNPDRPVTQLLKKSMKSYLARVNYGFANKYNFTLSMRADGSSVFPKNKWGYFPAAAFAWNVNNENFLKNVDNLSNLKVRLSYGQTGNAGIPYYLAFATMNDAFIALGGQSTAGLATQTIANSDIKWEFTDQYDAGLELGLFDHRINLTADVYYKKTVDLLLRKPLPLSTGHSSYLTNIGNIENKGFELSLKTINIDSDFKWETEFNFAINRNKVLSLGGEQTQQTFDDQFSNGEFTGLLKEGESLGVWYGYKTDGVFSYEHFEDDEITLKPEYESVYGNFNDTNPKLGDLKYVDLNGDGAIDSQDKTIIARTQPKHFGSLFNNFSYKGFELGLFFTYKYGVDVINGNRHRINGTGGANWNKYGELRDAWTPVNVTGQAPRPDYVVDKNFTDRVVEDGSFIRFQSINLSYNLPRKVTSDLGIESLKVYSNLDNVHVWTKYSGYDPEVSVARGQRSITSANLDYGAYPRTFNVSFGVKVGF